MGRSARIREQLISTFRAELGEHIQTMTDGLLALEQGRIQPQERPARLETIFRAAHSLKGAARAVNVTVIEQLAHSLENVLDAIQHDAVSLTPELFTACYRALDAIQAVQAAYEAGETTPPLEAIIALADLEAFRKIPRASGAIAPEAAAGAAQASAAVSGTALPDPPTLSLDDALAQAAAAASADPLPPERAVGGEDTVRVSVAKLDALMSQLSELLVARLRVQQRLEQSRELQEYLHAWQREAPPPHLTSTRLNQAPQDASGRPGVPPTGSPPERDTLLAYLDTNRQYLAEAAQRAGSLSRQYTEDALHLSMAIEQLEAEIKRIRMLPLSTITAPWGRMVRDLAQEAGKEAHLEIVGGDTELDKQILEQTKDPLVHILRNAIDHGIESPQARQAAGKPRMGRIVLSAERQGPDVAIRVSDDGAGLDLDALRRALARRGRGDTVSLTEDELRDLIFSPGVSTSPLITGISGRGLGLAVARRNVQALHGQVDVETVPGQGATFVLRLPLTLTSLRALLVRCTGQVFAFPLSAISSLRLVRPGESESLGGREAIEYRGQQVVIARLNDVLELPAAATVGSRAPRTVVILAAGERLAALVVDELLGEQEIVVKGLGPQLERVTGLAGATVLGNREVVLILDPVDIVHLALQGRPRPLLETQAGTPEEEQEEPARYTILVVDDSITTRTLEKNILEAAGYTVELATDGLEALSVIATRGLPDLVVSDILMPSMNGFELTEQLRAQEQTASLPVILVSSLDSTEDRTRGIQAGADAYIVKSQFDQANLLDTIQQLI